MTLTTKLTRMLNFGVSPRLGDILSDLHGVQLNVGPTSGTPNTNLTVAHGLKNAAGQNVAPYDAHVTRGNLYIVSFDAVNIVVASTAATQSGVVTMVPSAADNYTGPRKTSR